MTEHAAVIFVFFFLAEYSSIVVICILTSILFFGGYLIDINTILYIFNSIKNIYELSLLLVVYLLLNVFTLAELISEWFIEVIHLVEYMFYIMYSLIVNLWRESWEIPMFYETKLYGILISNHLDFFSWIWSQGTNYPLKEDILLNITSIITNFNSVNIELPSHIFSNISVGLFSSIILGFKTCVMIFIFIWARASLPRIRFDQLMSFCWTVLLPIIVAFIVLIPCILYGFDILPTNINLL
jgi:NADH dehydrogenase